MKTLLAKLLPALGLAALAAIWCTFVVVLSGPALLERLEPLAGRPLVYEFSVRVLVVAVLALMVVLWGAHLAGRRTVARAVPFVAFVLSVIGVAFVCFADNEETLGAEYSWIRYATAIFLVAAAAVAGVVARSYARAGERLHVRLWVVLSIVFVGLAGDELFMFHEAFGFFIQSRFHATHLATDLVTLMYPLVALALVLFLASKPAYLREYLVGHATVLALFVSAALVFLVAQLGDTFDKWTHQQLVTYGVARAANPERLFSDFWYPIWGPKQLMNDLEEVLECIASALFCSSFVLLMIERRRPSPPNAQPFTGPQASRIVIAVVVIGVTALSVWLASGRSIDSAAVGYRAQALLTAQDGLFHTDVVFHHPRWGLLVANEGPGNVVQYRDGVVRVLPDPDSLVSDTDCVTATDEAVYASCPSLHSVFEYTEAGGWRPFATEADGLRSPEALVVVDSLMYVLDEDHHVIVEIDMTTKQVREMPLTDYRWSWPEGLAYHPGLGRLLITDDTRGIIATVDFGREITPFASSEQGLANPEDICVTGEGRIFVSDTGRREIIELTSSGEVVNRVRFRPMYGYLVGVAVIEDPEGGDDQIFAVNADGYNSISFMPSTLWKLTVPRPR